MNDMESSGAEQTDTIINADARDAVADLPDNSVDLVVTSTPYWGQRDYQIKGQLGVEEQAQNFVDELAALGAELLRVVDGSLWLNLGDTLNGASIIRPESMAHPDAGDEGYEDQLAKNRADSGVRRRSSSQWGLPRQTRMLIPSRIALRLIEQGWLLRDEVVWAKPQPKPEGRVQSRLTQSHERVWRFATDETSQFDRDAVDDPVDVWEIETDTDSEHPAPMPLELARRAIRLTTEPGDVVLDPYCGHGTTCLAAKQLGREWIGVDLHPGHVARAQQRLGQPVDEPDHLDGQRGLIRWSQEAGTDD